MPKEATLPPSAKRKLRRPRPEKQGMKQGARAHGAQAGAAGKVIWRFGPGAADGDASMKQLLGGKGANLAEMCRLGLPVPPGFTIATSVCDRYAKAGGKTPPDVRTAVRAAM